jgi:hypothetical protein
VDDADGNLDGDDLTNAQEFAAGTAADDASDPPDVVYVSNVGDDSRGDGTNEKHWQTIGTAMGDVSRYSLWHEVTIRLGEGVYEEPVNFAENVTLAGTSTESTVIKHAPVAVYGAEGTVLRDVTVAAPSGQSGAVTLVHIADVSMEVANVLLDGNDNLDSDGVVISGPGSDTSIIRDSLIRRVQFGVQAIDTTAAITRNTFLAISGDALFVRFPEIKQAEVGTIRAGDEMQVETTGLNVFRSVDGFLIRNDRINPEVMAERNDWGAYTTEEIASRISGLVDFEPYIGTSIDPGTVAVQLVDDDAGTLIPPGLNPTVEIPALGIGGTLNEVSGLILTADVPDGSYNLVASANGYFPVTRRFSQKDMQIVVLSIALSRSTDPIDIDGSGRVDAVDIQLVINSALTGDTEYTTDLDSDGTTNAVDTQMIINAALGM